jgi:hypothetical protein
MVKPRFGSGLYGCCGAKKPAGERNNYCPSCKQTYMAQWRAVHHRRGDPYYEHQLEQSRRAGKERTRERREDRAWRGRRVRNAIADLNDAGIGCQEIAHRLGVSEMSVYDWRSGKRTPIGRNAERLYRLANEVVNAGVAA